MGGVSGKGAKSGLRDGLPARPALVMGYASYVRGPAEAAPGGDRRGKERIIITLVAWRKRREGRKMSRVVHRRIKLETEGNTQILEITEEVRRLLEKTGMRSGVLTVFVPGATGAVTTLEHEPGVCRDFQELFDFIAPPGRDYHHNRRGVDSNGHSHVRAGLLGPSISIPFEEGRPLLGRWQQIVFVDFDERPRSRSLVVTFMGE